MMPSATFAPMVPVRDTAPEPLGQRRPRHQPVAGTASRSTARARAFTCSDATVAPLSHDGSSSADAANARTRRSLAGALPGLAYPWSRPDQSATTMTGPAATPCLSSS